jgi:hypothetical protein
VIGIGPEGSEGAGFILLISSYLYRSPHLFVRESHGDQTLPINACQVDALIVPEASLSDKEDLVVHGCALPVICRRG